MNWKEAGGKKWKKTDEVELINRSLEYFCFIMIFNFVVLFNFTLLEKQHFNYVIEISFIQYFVIFFNNSICQLRVSNSGVTEETAIDWSNIANGWPR